ncbi:hypothetical protein AOQ84DRAFT_390829 [Glonium stellatum]|uniref:Heterokaryon incompatibility domain-containing protein n=1 Tax=Glonium stellatum TaxID=574774 RepID=A0A8E2EVT0_9PEZI|nr:hypothetical protein AOQ84DRAFT_390829 [Glonium stellatum]
MDTRTNECYLQPLARSAPVDQSTSAESIFQNIASSFDPYSPSRRTLQNKLGVRAFRARWKNASIERKTLAAYGLAAREPSTHPASSNPSQSQHPLPYAALPEVCSNRETSPCGSLYEYDRLPHVESSIRLIRIQPGSFSDPLACSLEIADLYDTSTPYEAFSYAWGDATTKVCIECNGRDLWVTRSLRDALCRVRLEGCARIVWADAISINQDDIEERGHQVSLMRRIYQRAKRVLIWLGDDTSRDAISAFSTVCILINANGLHPSTTASFKKSLSGETVIPSNLELLSTQTWKGPLQSLAVLYNLSWFWRLWVVQEIVLASSAVLLWGDAEIEWQWVGLAAAWIRTYEPRLLRQFDLSGVYNAYLMHHLSTERNVEGISFLRLLGLTRQFGVTDPRDRVFALLGIQTADCNLEDSHIFMEPDYALSTAQVYQRFARAVLRKERSLRILSAVQHRPKIDTNFPSWVPQWNDVFSHALSPSEPGPNHSAAAGLPMEEIQGDEDCPDILSLKGIQFDTVTKSTDIVSPQSFQAYSQSETAHFAVFAFLEALWEFLGSPLDCDSWKTLCWTLTAGKDWYGMLAEDLHGHWAGFKDFVFHFSFPSRPGPARRYRKSGPRGEERHKSDSDPEDTDDAYGTKSDGFLEAASNACVGRKLFITSKGHLGLGPGALEEGDVVCILFGGIVPFILRRSDDGSWLLVGECYIRGFMQGEVVTEWRDGKLSSYVFRLH